MALYHFNLRQISRNKGQSAIASAAYRSGEKLYSTYYGEPSDYTRKGGVVLAEIHLPEHAPACYSDRQTLWNAVEWGEKNKGAQLAHSFEITLMNEFSMEENIELGRRFVEEQLVARGMIADFCVHDPKKKEGEEPNPHMHIMVPIRPLNSDGTWGVKQKKEPILDENGTPILGKGGKPKMRAVSTTNWSSKETLLAMRKAWADMNNELFAQKGLSARISEESYEARGIDRIPMVHEGPNIRAMEEKGIHTVLGDLNRMIRWANRLLERTKGYLDWLFGLKEKLKFDQSLLKESMYEPNLAGYLQQYCDYRNVNAEKFQYGTEKAKRFNLKEFADAICFLQTQKLETPDDLQKKIEALSEELQEVRNELKSTRASVKEAEGYLKDYQTYKTLEPVFEELNKKWFGKKKYQESHAKELRQFYAVRRKLKESLEKTDTSAFNPKNWEKLAEKYREQEELFSDRKKMLEEELKPLEKIRKCVDYVSSYHIIKEIETPEPELKQQEEKWQVKEQDQLDKKKKKKHEVEI